MAEGRGVGAGEKTSVLWVAVVGVAWGFGLGYAVVFAVYAVLAAPPDEDRRAAEDDHGTEDDGEEVHALSLARGHYACVHGDWTHQAKDCDFHRRPRRDRAGDHAGGTRASVGQALGRVCGLW